MDADRARTFLLSLPHVVETQQWGANLVFWVGDKAIGGKMFALVDLEGQHHGKAIAISYSVGPERYAELLEIDGLIPAPYMARIFWVAAERWSALRNSEWEAELRAAHELTYAKLPPKVRATLALPKCERDAAIAARRVVLAASLERAAARKAAQSTAKAALRNKA